jgi:hypothetical protein
MAEARGVLTTEQIEGLKTLLKGQQ